MRTPLVRVEWWLTKEAWSSSGGTRGHADSESSSSVKRKESARSHRWETGKEEVGDGKGILNRFSNTYTHKKDQRETEDPRQRTL